MLADILVRLVVPLTSSTLAKDERHRSFQRALVSGSACALLFNAYGTHGDSAIALALAVAVSYFFLNLFYLHNLYKTEDSNVFFRYGFFLFDVPLFTLGLSLSPDDLSFAYAFVPIVVVGVGIRYGSRVLNFYWGLATASCVAMFILDPYWYGNIKQALMVVILIGLVPLTAGIVLRRNEKAMSDLEHMAFYDGLTGLSNRRMLMASLPTYRARAIRRNITLAVIFFDLDNFKAVNDQLGHEVGDRLLAKIGQGFRSNLRQEDLIARVGGDEFVVLAEIKNEMQDAYVICSKIMTSVKSAAADVCPSIGVSTSIGIALFPHCGSDINEDQLLNLADSAMYDAKRFGKNSISFAETPGRFHGEEVDDDIIQYRSSGFGRSDGDFDEPPHFVRSDPHQAGVRFSENNA